MDPNTLSPAGETKPWYLSKTIIGSVVAAGAIVAGFFGVSIDEATKSVILDQTEALIAAGFALVGTLLAIYGRVAAKKTIG